MCSVEASPSSGINASPPRIASPTSNDQSQLRLSRGLGTSVVDKTCLLVSVVMLYPLLLTIKLLAQQAVGSKNEHQHQDREGNSIIIAGTNPRDQRYYGLRQSKYQAASYHPPGRAQATQHHDNESSQRERSPNRWFKWVEFRQHRASRTRQRRANRER